MFVGWLLDGDDNTPQLLVEHHTGTSWRVSIESRGSHGRASKANIKDDHLCRQRHPGYYTLMDHDHAYMSFGCFYGFCIACQRFAMMRDVAFILLIVQPRDPTGRTLHEFINIHAILHTLRLRGNGSFQHMLKTLLIDKGLGSVEYLLPLVGMATAGRFHDLLHMVHEELKAYAAALEMKPTRVGIRKKIGPIGLPCPFQIL